jgi:hypothetical protein
MCLDKNETSPAGSARMRRAEELRAAIAEADKGVFISHEAMLAWANSLGADKELEPPKPDISIVRE